VVVCMVLAACEKEIKMDLPSTSNMLVANCLFSPDTVFKVYVSRSAKVLGTDARESIENATVEIYKNEQIWETLTHIDKGIYTSVKFPEAGMEYTLKVSAPGYESISASGVAPEKTPLSNVTIKDSVYQYQGINPIMYAKISGEFPDPPSMENYYLLELSYVDTFLLEISYFNPIVSGDVFRKINLIDKINENPVFSSKSAIGLMMTDELFNGKNYLFKAYFESRFLNTSVESKKFTLNLKSLSKEAYYYYKTADMQISSENNPFSEPARVYTNITNGLGIFAGYNVSKVEFKIK